MVGGKKQIYHSPVVVSQTKHGRGGGRGGGRG